MWTSKLRRISMSAIFCETTIYKLEKDRRQYDKAKTSHTSFVALWLRWNSTNYFIHTDMYAWIASWDGEVYYAKQRFRSLAYLYVNRSPERRSVWRILSWVSSRVIGFGVDPYTLGKVYLRWFRVLTDILRYITDITDITTTEVHAVLRRDNIEYSNTYVLFKCPVCFSELWLKVLAVSQLAICEIQTTLLYANFCQWIPLKAPGGQRDN